MKIRVYLDNCCFNRPFDVPITPLVRLEAEAKMYVQRQILHENIELAWSFILDHESADNPYEDRKKAIVLWKSRAVVDIGDEEEVLRRALFIAKNGIKSMDALHVACAIQAQCHYFLTTDRKILNKQIDGITLLNPMDYIRIEGER